MPAQFTTKSVVWPENSDHVVITRNAPVPWSNPPTWTKTTIFDGMADFQDHAQALAYNPAGTVDSADARVIIDPLADGTLPAVKIDDVATVNGEDFTVVAATPRNLAPIHLAVKLKRGPIAVEQRVS